VDGDILIDQCREEKYKKHISKERYPFTIDYISMGRDSQQLKRAGGSKEVTND
jgi:hypothetical protein